MASKKQASRVKKITVSNLKAISELTVDFNGCTAIVTGGNNQGKSTFLRSIQDRIRGNKPDMVLKFGEREGFAELELTTGEKFIWTFDQFREKLSFISNDDIKTSVTKEIANRYFPATFEVDEFLTATPKKQKAILQELVGLDFSEVDTRYKAAYDDRTFKNRKATEERAKVVEVLLDLPAKEVDYIELEKELAGIDTHNARFHDAEQRLKDLVRSKEDNIKRIDTLKAEIKALEGRNAEISTKIDTGTQWLVTPENMPKSNAEELQNKIKKIKKQNEAIKKNNEAKKQEKAADKAEEEAKLADKAVKLIEQERTDMIVNAKIPDGFAFSEDGITYKGLPFTREQLSSSGIYIAALKLANMNLGEVKTLHFDASFLDKKNLEEIEKWAEKNKLQLLIEIVEREGGEIEYEILS